jgi:glycosyltransferase involved in cell wall biosynthesis
LKLLEYTGLGLPSVAARSTAVSYYFRSDECLLYPPGDAGALAEILDDLATDPGRLADYRERLVTARDRMSWSREKQKYVAMLQQLAGKHLPLADPSAARGSTR